MMNLISLSFIIFSRVVFGCNCDEPTMKSYCPSKSDFYATPWSDVTHYKQGSIVRGNSRMATKSSFNLLGGSIEFDVDLRNSKRGVNTAVYTIAPKFGGKDVYDTSMYCDGNSNNWCVELDFVESNGKCGGATTLHTRPGQFPGCTGWGCAYNYLYDDAFTRFKIDIAEDGKYTVYVDGKRFTWNDIVPKPLQSDLETWVKSLKENGAVIMFSSWTGWVPLDNKCGSVASNNVLETSSFSFNNLKITGKIVQGKELSLC